MSQLPPLGVGHPWHRLGSNVSGELHKADERLLEPGVLEEAEEELKRDGKGVCS